MNVNKLKCAGFFFKGRQITLPSSRHCVLVCGDGMEGSHSPLAYEHVANQLSIG